MDDIRSITEDLVAATVDYYCPLKLQMTDEEYGNLQIIHIDVHKLIHAKDKEEIQRLLESLQLTEFQIERVNLLRNRCNLFPI